MIDAAFKQIFNNAIDSLLAPTALSVPCKLHYDTTDATYCNNCIFDPISDKSYNRYNSTGPLPFVDDSICPVCGGHGKIICDSNETIYMAVIFDSKYWMNWGPKFVQIPNLAAQSLCSITFMPKIMNCTKMNLVNTDSYDNGYYSKAGQPTLMGLGDHKYILTNWTRP